MTQSNIIFKALPADAVEAIRGGATDAYGLPPERRAAEGSGLPCRYCLQQVPPGRDYLTLAWRPFTGLQPYAETGPIFLCADCVRATDSAKIPAILSSPEYIIRGYGTDDRIVYGTGRIVATPLIPQKAAQTLSDPRVAYLHVRSARNNCYQLRIDRV